MFAAVANFTKLFWVLALNMKKFKYSYYLYRFFLNYIVERINKNRNFDFNKDFNETTEKINMH